MSRGPVASLMFRSSTVRSAFSALSPNHNEIVTCGDYYSAILGREKQNLNCFWRLDF